MNTRRLVTLTAMFTLINMGGLAQQPATVAAHWEGEIQAPDHELRITLDLAKNPRGKWIGSVSIPDANLTDLPLIGVSVVDTSIRFGLDVSHASFEGKLSEDGSELAGTAKSDRGPAPFHLKRSGEANVKVAPASTALSKEFEGSWEGTLDAPGRQLRAVLKLARASDGIATGTLTSVDEGGQEFPITTITQKDKQLQFEVRVFNGKYTGVLNDSGAEIAGEYTLPGLTLPLVFKRPTAEIKKP